MKSYKILGLLLLTSTQFYAQKKDENIGTEVVNIVKPYTPTISDAFKAKEVPVLEDEVNTQKEEINYSIFSFPVASTFTPAKGVAANVDPAEKQKYFQNYVRLGVGNYGTIDGEADLTYNLDRTNYLALFVNHRSSRGGIDDVKFDDKYSHSAIKGYYGSKSNELDWKIGLGYNRDMYNWYGTSPTYFDLIYPINASSFDVKNVYTTIVLDGQAKMNDGVLDNGNFFFKRFTDKKDSQENHFHIKPTASFEVNGFDIQADVVVDYLGGSFARGYNQLTMPAEQKYSYFNVGLQPRLRYVADALNLQAGLGVFYSMGKNNDESNNNFYIFPQIKASYTIVDGVLMAFAGAEGNLQQNSFATLIDKNPFLSPTQFIKPTSNLYDVYLGLNGKLSSKISFNVKGSYKQQNDYTFFVLNALNNPIYPSTGVQAYELGNSFGVVYDDLKTLSFSGELRYDISKDSNVGFSGEFNSYTTDQQEAWHLPTFKIGADANFKITNKWFAGANVFFVGERYGLENYILTSDIDGSISSSSNKVTLDSYFDVNAKVLYKHNERISGFLKLNNIAGQNYMRYTNYPVQGFQVLVGASYNFDF